MCLACTAETGSHEGSGGMRRLSRKTLGNRIQKDKAETTAKNEDDTHLEHSFTLPFCKDKKTCPVKMDCLPITDLTEPMDSATTG